MSQKLNFNKTPIHELFPFRRLNEKQVELRHQLLEELILKFFLFIDQPKDVANLNCVCKQFKVLNQNEQLAKFRLQRLFFKKPDLFNTVPFSSQKYSYNDFINTIMRPHMNDAKLLFKIRSEIEGVFSPKPGVPSPVRVSLALRSFAQIANPVIKLKALQTIILGVYSTDGIARQFYSALPFDMQAEFRRQIWEANGKNDEGYGDGFDEYVIATAIRGPLVQRALVNYIASLYTAT